MASTYEYISALADDTASAVVKSEKEWKQYLTTAARLYKYPFKEQLLIYAQRPDASACASIEVWNRKMHSWVYRGSKGIALIDEENEHGGKLKYVFDVSDVYKLRRGGIDPNLWVLKEEHKESVLGHLEEIYGKTDVKEPFERRLIEIAEKIAEESYQELLPDLMYLAEGSYLEGLDGQNIGVRFRETLSSGISYMLLSRCGADMEEWEDAFRFEFVHEFNTKNTLTILGNSTADLSKAVLIEIRKAVRAYEREKARQKEQYRGQDRDKDNKRNNIYENLEKGLENNNGTHYNNLKRESVDAESNNGEGNHTEKGGSGNEHNLREERRLPDTEPESGRAAAGDSNEVWDAPGDIPEGTPQRSLFGISSGREIESTPVRDTGTGGNADGEHDREDGESAGRGRETESGKPDGLGAENEQHQGISGGSSSERTGILLICTFTSPPECELLSP